VLKIYGSEDWLLDWEDLVDHWIVIGSLTNSLETEDHDGKDHESKMQGEHKSDSRKRSSHTIEPVEQMLSQQP